MKEVIQKVYDLYADLGRSMSRIDQSYVSESQVEEKILLAVNQACEQLQSRMAGLDTQWRKSCSVIDDAFAGTRDTHSRQLNDLQESINRLHTQIQTIEKVRGHLFLHRR